MTKDSWVQANRPSEERFLNWLPRLRRVARQVARPCRCPHDRADAVADIVARAWEVYVQAGADLTLDGLLHAALPSPSAP